MARILELIWGTWEQKYFGKSEKKTRQPCRHTARRANHLIAARAAVARMERSAIRESLIAASVAPDFAALHPGYDERKIRIGVRHSPMCNCTSGMRLRSAIADLRRQARNPYSRSWLWIPGSLVSLAPSDAPIGASGNDDFKVIILQLHVRPRRGLADIFLGLLERAFQRLCLRHVADLGEMRRDRVRGPVGL